MADEPCVVLTVESPQGDPRTPDLLQRTWERMAPSWWRPRVGELVEPNGVIGGTYQVTAVTWVRDGLAIELEYTVGIGAPQSRWDEAYESLRTDGFEPVIDTEPGGEER